MCSYGLPKLAIKKIDNFIDGVIYKKTFLELYHYYVFSSKNKSMEFNRWVLLNELKRWTTILVKYNTSNNTITATRIVTFVNPTYKIEDHYGPTKKLVKSVKPSKQHHEKKKKKPSVKFGKSNNWYNEYDNGYDDGYDDDWDDWYNSEWINNELASMTTPETII